MKREMKSWKKNFLKMICVTLLMVVATSVNAQEKGDMAAGANIALGMGDSFTNFGAGAKFQWTVINNLRVEPSFTFFFKKDYVSMWDASINAHYLFSLADQMRVYPLAGIGILGSKVDLGDYGGFGVSGSNSEFSFNLGGGFDFDLTDKLILNLEAKYKIGDHWNRFILSAGVAFRF